MEPADVSAPVAITVAPADEPPRAPPDPLAHLFDLLVVGTGAVESVVAAAAARSGARVVHVDGNAFYGGPDATLPLSQASELLAFAPSAGATRLGGLLRVHGGCAPGLPPRLEGSPSRRVLIDLRPRVTLARGSATALLVASCAARYLDYRALDGAFVAPSGAAGAVVRVPASKGDVFLSKDLSLLDKRKAMKFMQRAADEAAAAAAAAAAAMTDARGEGDNEDVNVGKDVVSSSSAVGDASTLSSLVSLNETSLGMGRSLLRPQNKRLPSLIVGGGAASVDGVGSDSVPSSSFEASLAAEGITGQLSQLIRFGLAFEGGGDTPLSQQEGMQRVRAYAAAVGRFGATAFLATIYGTGELPQAFCRLAAVHGAVYMLDTEPNTWRVVTSTDAEAACAAMGGGVDEGGTRGGAAVDADVALALQEGVAEGGVPSPAAASQESVGVFNVLAVTVAGGVTLYARAALVSPQFAAPIRTLAYGFTEGGDEGCSPFSGVFDIVCACVIDSPIERLGAAAGSPPHEMGGATALLIAPPTPARPFPCVLLQQGAPVAVTTPGLWVVHVSARITLPPVDGCGGGGGDALEHAASLVSSVAREWVQLGVEEGEGANALPSSRPMALWHSVYSIRVGMGGGRAMSPPSNPRVLVTREELRGVGGSPWGECAVHSEGLASAAKAAFDALLPGRVWLPPEEPKGNGGHGGEEEA